MKDGRLGRYPLAQIIENFLGKSSRGVLERGSERNHVEHRNFLCSYALEILVREYQVVVDE